MKSIRVADYESDRAESLQFILNATQREIALPRDLPHKSRPFLTAKKQSKNFRPSFRK